MQDEYGEIIELIIPVYKDKITTFDYDCATRELIRCMDCKYAQECDSNFGRKAYFCEKNRTVHDEMWFCADAE